VSSDGKSLADGFITTEGQVRMIYVPSIMNVRDLGGWQTTDGKRIKYGKIYRGGELNGQYVATEEDIRTLRDLGIEAEIDMRYLGENDGAGTSAFGFLGLEDMDDDDDDLYTYLFTDNSGCCALQHLTLNYWQQRYKKEFLFIVENLRLGRPVYAHCIWGADRTGQLAILLEGLLGVPYDGLIKDLELTSFSGNVRKKEDRDFVFDYFNTMRGSTLQEKINYYFVNRLRISQADIDYFRSEMLEDDGDNSTVGISDAERQINEEIMNNKRYDGLGRAVDGLLNKGIYIKNGKKILNNK
jgi:protein-tyrosine phosphatase